MVQHVWCVQGAAQPQASLPLDPAQQLQQAQRESAQQQQARTNSAAGIAPGAASPFSVYVSLLVTC